MNQIAHGPCNAQGVSAPRARTVTTRGGHKPSVLDGIHTPDGRYIVVRGRLWRATNPSLGETERHGWVRHLMDARRAMGRARQAGDDNAGRAARRAVDEAKRALGERGPVWWGDGTPDHNRRLIENTPYRDWYEGTPRIVTAILRLLDARTDASICPSEVARAEYPNDWRKHMDDVREAARHLARRGLLTITQRGKRLDPERAFRGPIRLRRYLPDASAAARLHR